MQSSAEFPDPGKTISADTVRDGSAVSACALYILGVLQVCKDGCVSFRTV